MWKCGNVFTDNKTQYWPTFINACYCVWLKTDQPKAIREKKKSTPRKLTEKSQSGTQFSDRKHMTRRKIIFLFVKQKQSTTLSVSGSALNRMPNRIQTNNKYRIVLYCIGVNTENINEK